MIILIVAAKITCFKCYAQIAIITLSKENNKPKGFKVNLITATNSNQIETMSSTQLAEMLHFESKSSLNRAIRNMFSSKIDDAVIASSMDSRGYVSEYYLPELESKMFVAKHDINYLEEVTQFWIDFKNKPIKPQLPTNYLEALEKLIETEKEKIAISHERDEAIKTKAHISDKKTATAMNTASRLSKENKLLQSKLQDVGTYQSIIAAQLPERIETELNPKAQTWRVLLKFCKEMNLPPKKVKDSRFGEVNTYHVDVINRVIDCYL